MRQVNIMSIIGSEQLFNKKIIYTQEQRRAESERESKRETRGRATKREGHPPNTPYTQQMTPTHTLRYLYIPIHNTVKEKELKYDKA